MEGTGYAVGIARRDGRNSGFGIGWVISDSVSKSGYQFFSAIIRIQSLSQDINFSLP